MGRPQTIFVNCDTLLLNVCGLWTEALAELEALVAAGQRRLDIASEEDSEAWEAVDADRFNPTLRDKHNAAMRKRREEGDYLQTQQKKLDRFLDRWLPYDLHMITGRDELTPSERLRTNQALRAMEARGLVLIDGRRATAIRPTDAGLARAKQLMAAEVAKLEAQAATTGGNGNA